MSSTDEEIAKKESLLVRAESLLFHLKASRRRVIKSLSSINDTHEQLGRLIDIELEGVKFEIESIDKIIDIFRNLLSISLTAWIAALALPESIANESSAIPTVIRISLLGVKVFGLALLVVVIFRIVWGRQARLTIQQKYKANQESINRRISNSEKEFDAANRDASEMNEKYKEIMREIQDLDKNRKSG